MDIKTKEKIDKRNRGPKQRTRFDAAMLAYELLITNSGPGVAFIFLLFNPKYMHKTYTHWIIYKQGTEIILYSAVENFLFSKFMIYYVKTSIDKHKI
jgi:hypothetical protein